MTSLYKCSIYYDGHMRRPLFINHSEAKAYGWLINNGGACDHENTVVSAFNINKTL